MVQGPRKLDALIASRRGFKFLNDCNDPVADDEGAAHGEISVEHHIESGAWLSKKPLLGFWILIMRKLLSKWVVTGGLESGNR